MTHREIRGLLADSAQGRLDETDRATVAEHLAECPSCQRWLETYNLLGRALGEQTALEHPDAAQLADWAVLGEELSEEAKAHVEACAVCARDLELLGAALAEARGGERRARRRMPPRRRAAAAAWAAAAGVILALLTGSILLSVRSGAKQEQLIAGGSLTGETTIAARSIYASDVEILDGGNIVFSAGSSVSLGEGFVVASGARFAAGAIGGSAERPRSTKANDTPQPTQGRKDP